MRHFMIMLAMVCLLMSCHGQTSGNKAAVGDKVILTGPPSEKVLIADETWVVASGKSSFRLMTSNDSIAHWVTMTYENHGLDKVTYTKKQDRRGGYWQRDFYFKNEMWNSVAAFIAKLH